MLRIGAIDVATRLLRDMLQCRASPDVTSCLAKFQYEFDCRWTLHFLIPPLVPQSGTWLASLRTGASVGRRTPRPRLPWKPGGFARVTGAFSRQTGGKPSRLREMPLPGHA